MTVIEIAVVCHEVNREYCRALGDDSQKAWLAAPEWQRESAIDGVKFHLSAPNAGPEASHESWCDTKVADGWKYGAVKDEVKKEHPCLVPFAKLPVDQQAKDFIFSAIVRQLSRFCDRATEGGH